MVISSRNHLKSQEESSYDLGGADSSNKPDGPGERHLAGGEHVEQLLAAKAVRDLLAELVDWSLGQLELVEVILPTLIIPSHARWKLERVRTAKSRMNIESRTKDSQEQQ